MVSDVGFSPHSDPSQPPDTQMNLHSSNRGVNAGCAGIDVCVEDRDATPHPPTHTHTLVQLVVWKIGPPLHN